MFHDFGQRGHRADLDAVVCRAHSFELFDSAQIHHYFRLPDAILQPVETVHPASHHPRVRTMLFEKPLRVRRRARLKKLESAHYVSYYSHWFLSNSLLPKCEP